MRLQPSRVSDTRSAAIVGVPTAWGAASAEVSHMSNPQILTHRWRTHVSCRLRVVCLEPCDIGVHPPLTPPLGAQDRAVHVHLQAGGVAVARCEFAVWRCLGWTERRAPATLPPARPALRSGY